MVKIVKIWHGKEATIKIDATGDVTLTNATVHTTAFSGATAVEGQIKDWSINVAIGDVEKIDLVGTTTQDSTAYQNAELEEKPAGLVEISGTIIIPGDEKMEGEMFGSGTAASGTHTTYEPLQSSRTKVALLLSLDDSTDSVSWAGRNLIVTQSDVSLTGADGHWEGAVTFKCLPRDFFGPQFKD